MHRQFTLMKDGTIKCSERDGEGTSVTWEGWHPPLHLKLSFFSSIFAKRQGMGERVPPWYYGLSYAEDFDSVYTYHIIPFNLAIRAARWVEWMWGWLRTRRSYFDAQILEARARGFEEGREFERRLESRKTEA